MIYIFKLKIVKTQSRSFNLGPTERLVSLQLFWFMCSWLLKIFFVYNKIAVKAKWISNLSQYEMHVNNCIKIYFGKICVFMVESSQEEIRKLFSIERPYFGKNAPAPSYHLNLISSWILSFRSIDFQSYCKKNIEIFNKLRIKKCPSLTEIY